MADQKSKFTSTISPLVEGQVPDFIRADHPVFVDFVKDYFKFLEAGRLTLSATVNGELDENLYSLMQQYGIMGKDGTNSGSTTIVIPMGKVSGKLPKDDGYVFNVLDKIQKQRNSASGGGASKFNK